MCTMRVVRLRSYAKINLGLRILGKRADGYHDIWTVFQQVSLADELVLETQPHQLEVLCHHPSVAKGEENLCWRAAAALKQATGCHHGVRISVRKRIPVGAGLGGGSSNAAVVLAALNVLWGTGLKQAELMDLAATLGSDVPFFLLGGTAVGEGRGERLTPVALSDDYWCVVAMPNVEISTRWAYSAAKFDLTKSQKCSTFSSLAEELSDRARWPSILGNDFEQVVFDAYPSIATLKAELTQEGSFYCSLSGSGGAVFGLFARRDRALQARLRVAKSALAFVVRPIRWGCEGITKAIAEQLSTA